ncbi:PAS domain S-box protein [Halomicrobium urmianum]|uniref:PAS domain S-box protein n=1 Tax=Halomicrobium urmianum TaxID=1586233 RepID=UPI001CDA29D4|nr:PAS domain S-box protein [Halomicrobium urmianum]
MEDGTKSVSILVIDDDSDVAELTARSLERRRDRFSADVTTDARDGLDLLDDGDFDCVVSDYKMPDMDGLALLASVRKEYGDLPFVLFTGHGGTDIASEAIARGATDYLRKEPGPERLELLAERVEDAVRKHRATERIDGLERALSVSQAVHRTLMESGTRSEIEREICEALVDAGPYASAWIDDRDPESSDDEPRAKSGIDRGGPGLRGPSTDGPDVGGTGARAAIQTRDTDVGEGVQDADEPAQTVAPDLDGGSVVAVPLDHDGTRYGDLYVYADGPAAFDLSERDLLTELGSDIARALDRAETKTERAQYERVVEALPIGVFRTVSEPDGEIVDADQTLAETFGRDSAEALLGCELGDLFRQDGDGDSFGERFDGEGVVGEVERCHETADGDEVQLSVTAVRTEVDGQAYFDGAVRDVTHHRERQSKLRQFRSAVEHAGHVVLITDADGQIEYVNDAFEDVTGYDAAEAVGETPRLLNSGEHDEGFYEDLWSTISDGDVWQGEIVNERKDGSQYVIDQTIAPIKHGDEVDGYVAINRDVTTLKEYERELEAQNERLKRYGHNVAHDLRNPLTRLNGEIDRIQAALGGEVDPDAARAGSRRISDIVGEMETLIDDLLAMAELGQLVIDPERISLEGVAREAWRQVDTEAAELTVQDAAVRADHDRLRELLSNLFRNAVEHAGPDVRVRVAPLDRDEGFLVEDDGPGISPDERDRVFDRGFTTSDDGTGFGLAIVEQIAEAHGWTTVVVDGSDGGARFEFRDVDQP